MERRLGRSGITISAMGLGCWAIGGPFRMDGRADGWGEVDDAESVRAIHAALDLGITFFDTADAYGTGHSEMVLGRALAGRRDRAVVATKFGYTYDAARRELTGTDTTTAYVRTACEASLRRLGTDYLDLYQLHVGDVPEPAALDVLGALETLRLEGMIRSYGWSTGDPGNATLLATRSNGTSVQHPLNVVSDAAAILDVCAEHDLASIGNGPLAMGMLTGKFGPESVLPPGDVRGSGHAWLAWFTDGRPRPEVLGRLEAVRAILASGGRTLAQGALAWIWARSPRTVPIPGFRTVAQVEENAAAMRFGPLTPEQLGEVERLLRPAAHEVRA